MPLLHLALTEAPTPASIPFPHPAPEMCQSGGPRNLNFHAPAPFRVASLQTCLENAASAPSLAYTPLDQRGGKRKAPTTTLGQGYREGEGDTLKA